MTLNFLLRHWWLLILLVLPMGVPAQGAAAPASVPDTSDNAFRAFADRARQPGVRSIDLDPAHTAFGFELRTRWGQRVQGRFPVYDGVVLVLPDGRRQVRIRLSAGAVEVDGSERYAELARGETFFDAARHPDIEFVSDPQADVLTHQGGLLPGQLRLRGITRPETFVIEPASCVRAGEDCDAVANGSVARSDYDIAGMRMVISDRVRFTMRVRLRERLP